MYCELELCIYNRDFNCLCGETKLNELGMCDGCILVDFDKKFLEKEKERQLDELEKRWNSRN